MVIEWIEEEGWRAAHGRRDFYEQVIHTYTYGFAYLPNVATLLTVATAVERAWLYKVVIGQQRRDAEGGNCDDDNSNSFIHYSCVYRCAWMWKQFAIWFLIPNGARTFPLIERIRSVRFCNYKNNNKALIKLRVQCKIWREVEHNATNTWGQEKQR